MSAAPEKMVFHLTLRRRGISDQAVLRAMDEVPRDAFVEPTDRGVAWSDTALPIACGQTISQPFVVAYMTEQLRLNSSHRVLEIGTGSGYQAAVLSRLSREVVSVERYRQLAERARERMARLRYDNVDIRIADGLNLPEMFGRFDRIIVTAAVENIPPTLTALLADGAVLIAPVGPHNGSQTLVRLTREGGKEQRKDLVGVRFVPALAGLAREL